MYVITGATGHTGHPLTLALLNAGKQVRIISRDAEKAKDLTAAGAELVLGSSTDPETLKKAFQGAKAVYAMIPPQMVAEDFYGYQQQTADAIASAIESNNVPYAVTLSSIGAHLPQGAGVVQGLHYFENRLNQIEGLNVLHLRPGYFMENTLGMAQYAKMFGFIGSPVSPTIPIPMIATQDIANYAAKRLNSLDFNGKSHQYLLGNRDVTYQEAAKVYGSVVGKPKMPYVTVPTADMRKSMINEWGMSESATDKMLEFMDCLNEGKILEDVNRDAEATTPTRVEEFAQVFKAAYDA